MMADEYILKRNALAILMGDKVDLSPNFVPVSMAIDPSSIAKFKDINFTCDRHIDLIKAIPAEDVAPAKKWIPVSETLPKVGENVLVISYGRVCFAKLILTKGDNGYPTFVLQDGLNNKPVLETTTHNEHTENRITHWMPLPEPPKDGE